jgi:hypothetical protein
VQFRALGRDRARQLGARFVAVARLAPPGKTRGVVQRKVEASQAE